MKISNLIHIQTKSYLVLLTHKIDAFIALTTFINKCEKKQKMTIYTDGRVGVNIFHIRWKDKYWKLSEKNHI